MTTFLSRVISRRTVIALTMMAGLGLGGVLHSSAAHAATNFTIWTTSYYEPQTCSGDTCTVTSDGDIPRFKVSGEGFSNNGRVFIGIYATGTTDVAARWNLTATYHEGFYWGSFGQRTGWYNCSSDDTAPYNYYVQAYDRYTGTWSNRIYLQVCTNVL